MSTPSNPAQLKADEKFDGPFHAYVIITQNNDFPTTVVCFFLNVDICKQWWELITKISKANGFSGSYTGNMTGDACKKHSMQWYTWPSGYPVECMRDIEKHSDMKDVKGKWSYKCTKGNNESGGAPSLPVFQDDSGWPKGPQYQYNVPAVLPNQNPTPASSEKTNEAILTALERINTTLESMQTNMQSMSLATTSSSGGEGWVDGASGPGGQASYQVVENAFRKAKELKDRGDNRSFGMIFAQLSMELRRKV